MTATNHALTGAIIGLSITNPYIALSLAFMSHFVLDALPHFGKLTSFSKYIVEPSFTRYLIIDASLCVGIVAVIFIVHPVNWFLASVCAFTATSPDLMWAGNYFRARAGQKMKVYKGLFAKFHSKIQWFQRPSGAFVELVWMCSCVFTILLLIRR